MNKKWMNVKRMHPNSIEAYYAGKLNDVFSERESQILKALEVLGRATDRQIKEYLGFDDMNACRPRISELIEARIVEEVARERDEATGIPVRIVRIIPENDTNQLQFNW